MVVKIENQKNLILKRDWDILIILDACRYDYFEKVHGDYLKGNLRKVKSECLSNSFWKDFEGRTVTWLQNTFPRRMEDVVYVSGIPHVNSMGIDTSGKGFNPPEVFPTIIDVWDWGWDNKVGTTPPDKMVKGARKAKREYSKKDQIIHFTQPHAPYLALGGNEEKADISSGTSQNFLKKGRKIANQVLKLLFSEKKVSDFRKFFGLADYQNQTERVAKKYNKRCLETFYEYNLRSALKSVKKITRLFSDRSIIVSADHGEFLGEDALYGHCWEKEFLSEVPWFEVESARNNLDENQII